MTLYHLPNHQQCKYRQNVNDFFTVKPQKNLLFQVFRIFWLTFAQKVFFSENKSDQSSNHTNTGSSKSIAPSIRLTQIAAQNSCKPRSNINPHVENGKPGVSTTISLFV